MLVNCKDHDEMQQNTVFIRVYSVCYDNAKYIMTFEILICSPLKQCRRSKLVWQNPINPLVFCLWFNIPVSSYGHVETVI